MGLCYVETLGKSKDSAPMDIDFFLTHYVFANNFKAYNLLQGYHSPCLLLDVRLSFG